MGKAQKKLGQNKPERSLEDMDQAMKKLADAKKALEQMAEDAKRDLLELPFEQQARKQEITRIKTDKLAADMEKAGEGKDGQPKKETPGTKNVQQAVPKHPVAPRRTRNILLSGVLGLMLGVFGALFLEYLRTTPLKARTNEE